MGPKEEVAAKPLGKPVRVLLAVWLLLGLPPVLIDLFGFDFLPSIEWISKTKLPGFAVGLVSAMLPLGLALKGWHTNPDDEVRKALGVLLVPFLCYFLGKNIVVATAPMMLALIAGHQVELPLPWYAAIPTVIENVHHRLNSKVYRFSSTQFATSTSGRAFHPEGTSSSSATAPV